MQQQVVYVKACPALQEVGEVARLHESLTAFVLRRLSLRDLETFRLYLNTHN